VFQASNLHLKNSTIAAAPFCSVAG